MERLITLLLRLPNWVFILFFNVLGGLLVGIAAAGVDMVLDGDSPILQFTLIGGSVGLVVGIWGIMDC
jgi:hypothetical protein